MTAVRIPRQRTLSVRERIVARSARNLAPPPEPVMVGGGAKKKGQAGLIHTLEDGEQVILDLLKAGRPPYQKFREGKYTHVSDVISKCARKIALIRRLGTNHVPQRLLDGHALTFAQGDAIHDFIKVRFMQSHPDKVWAQWQCRCGATTTAPMLYEAVPDTPPCKKCDHVPDKYVEVKFEDDEREVVGSPDLLLYFSQHKAYYVTEVKSISKDLWEAMNRPQPDHIIQALYYWRLMRDKGYPIFNQASILYVKKEYTWQLPYKEFIIKPEGQLKRLKDFDADLCAIRDARDPKFPLPVRVVCGSADAPDAKNCPVCTTCFAIK